MASRNYQSYQGPTDPNLRHSEIEGYQPVSRIGEVVINCFIDSYEFTALPESVAVKDVEPSGGAADDKRDPDMLVLPYEHKPHFHEWATALPGMICVSRKARNSTFRNYVAAETATPVISCCACLGSDDQKNFYFAGVARSKSVRPIDDGVGPQIDEFFTLAIGGMCTLLNNSGTVLYPGDMCVHSAYLVRTCHSCTNTTHKSMCTQARVVLFQPEGVLVVRVQGRRARQRAPQEDHGQDCDRRQRARHRPRGTHKPH